MARAPVPPNRASSLWIVRRSLDALADLPRAAPVQGPDASINVPAMAAYIGFAGHQIALPTLAGDARTEVLIDGERLLAALAAADWKDPVLCLLRAPKETTAVEAERFTLQAADRCGTDAVLVSFSHQLAPAQAFAWGRRWTHPPTALADTHFGWPSLAAAGESDWIGFVRRLEAMQPEPAPVVAINGRHAPWLPADRRG